METHFKLFGHPAAAMLTVFALTGREVVDFIVCLFAATPAFTASPGRERVHRLRVALDDDANFNASSSLAASGMGDVDASAPTRQ